MDCQRRWGWLSSAWFLILTQAVHHRYVGQFTAVGTYYSLLELSAISFMDEVEVGFYNKENQQLIIKIPWLTEALGDAYIIQKRNLLVYHEQHFRWMMHFLAMNDTNHNRNHTVQLLADCEIDNDIKVKSYIHIIWDGEEIYRIDEEVGQWEYLKPEAKQYQHILESPFWTDLRKRYMNQFCVDFMKKIMGYKSIRDNVPPEMTVSYRVNTEGSIILSCTATGFYPRSIQLQWEKNGELGVWGKETSTGILPNMDSTFYLRLTLELPPEDPGMNFTCVVEHVALKTPALYSVPEKPTLEKPWVLTLSIMLAVILLMSCAGAFILWKKRKSGVHVMRER
ncbi:major histocompatibility complex class I-related gene protein-like [Sarcophilus harrisii]|uniref:major histocompatibility complex class I-related gene protein-like n=1 Tax=Sarcophilus harrisii TaxID=9305 RepID=UPI001301D8F8|nr:major histocompatibility complex class I-related gene protein-like [Sarcophilus harrisii]